MTPSSTLLRIRRYGNLLNLSTPLGLAIAVSAGCGCRRGADGIVLADGYRPRFPYAGAFTVGCVLISRRRWSEQPAGVVAHEEKHSWQWLALGPLFLPAYTLAMGWSWLRAGDRASANLFERLAGLTDGGYREAPLRSWRAVVVELVDGVRLRTRRRPGPPLRG